MRAPSSASSSRKGYARELKLPREKRVRYEVSDRFYNIYYLLRFSRTGRHRLERLVHFLHDLFGPTGMRAMYPAALEVLREHELPAGDMSDLLGILARFVASDTGYEGRENWRQHAMDLINKVIGAEAPVLKEIELAFAGQHPPEYRDFLDKLRNGIEMLEGERYEDAEALYREAIPEAPADALAWQGLGISLLFQERFEECLGRFRSSCRSAFVQTAQQDFDTQQPRHSKRPSCSCLPDWNSLSSFPLFSSKSRQYVNSDDSPQLRESVVRLMECKSAIFSPFKTCLKSP